VPEPSASGLLVCGALLGLASKWLRKRAGSALSNKI